MRDIPTDPMHVMGKGHTVVKSHYQGFSNQKNKPDDIYIILYLYLAPWCIQLCPSPAPLDEDLSLPDKTIGKASTATIASGGT